MHPRTLRTASMVVLAAPLALAACASERTPAVTRADLNSAVATADQAKSEADKALQTAEKAEHDAQAAEQRADKMYDRSLRK